MRQKKNYAVLLFLLNPFIGANYALFNLKKNKQLNSMLWLLFCFLYGYFYIAPSDGDYYTYLSRFNLVSKLNFHEFSDYLSTQVDFLIYIILYLFSFIADSYDILWGLISLTFGFLILKTFININSLINEKSKISPALIKTTLITLIFISSLYLVYNFRFWIGVVFIYLGLSYYLLGLRKKMYVCFIFASVTHFGLIIFVLILLAGILYKFNLKFLVALSLTSIVIGQLNTNEIIKYIPDFIMDTRGGYVSDENITNYQLYRNNVNWYVFGFEKLLYYSTLAFVILNLKSINRIDNKRIMGLASILLLSYSFVNLIITLPLAERFRRVVLFIAMLYILCVSITTKTKYNLVLNGICIFYIIIETRKLMGSLNLGLILPTAVPSLFIEKTSVFSFIFG
ncbi:EpsG family protein [Aequorivita viscosa]|nr:EpsG family protein [Aequorivita viscosa]